MEPENSRDHPDSAEPHTSSAVGGLCRLSSQDSSYLVVHKDAHKSLHKPKTVSLTYAEAGEHSMSSWFIRHIGPVLHLEHNVALYQQRGACRSCPAGWTPYERDSRDPDTVGDRVAAAVAAFRDAILKKKPDASEVVLQAYKVDATFTSSDGTSTFLAEVAVGENHFLYMRLTRQGKTDLSRGYIKGETTLGYLSDTPE